MSYESIVKKILDIIVKEVNLDEAEKLFKSYYNKTKNFIEQIK